MRPISEQDHYEILEIASDATLDEIERAFRMAQATYGDDSMAGYSVFGEGEAQAIRERIEIAYRVLSDAESRSAYDASLAGVAAPQQVGDRFAQFARQVEDLGSYRRVLQIQDYAWLDARVLDEFQGLSGLGAAWVMVNLERHGCLVCQ